jgi:hypothetical protein
MSKTPTLRDGLNPLAKRMVEIAAPERRAKRSGKVKPWAGVGLTAFVLSSPAHATGPTAAELLQACTTAPGAPTAFCKSYIRRSLHDLATSPITRTAFCFPDPIDIDHAIGLFAETAAAMDKRRGLEKQGADDVLVIAAEKEFLCMRR